MVSIDTMAAFNATALGVANIKTRGLQVRNLCPLDAF
jgi:hypothetical protein